MKQLLMPLILAFLFLPGAAGAADCAYCVKLEEIRKGFAETKPDATNDATADRQVELLNDTEALAIKVLTGKKEPAQADWERIVPLLATAAEYDFDNTLAEDISAALNKREGKFRAEVARQKAAGLLTESQADALGVAYGTADYTRHHGTEGHGPKKND